MKPVLIINLSKWFGGAEVRVFETASAIEGVYPYGVVTLADSPLHKKLVDAGLKVFPLSFSRGDFRLAISISRIIRQYGFEIMDMHNPQSHFWGMIASKMSGLRHMVTTVHNTKDLTTHFFKTYGYEKVMQLNGIFDSHFIAVSRSVHDYLTALHIKPEKISLIANGIAPFTSSSADTGSEIRRSFGWNEDHFVVIAVGRLEPVKGHAYLVEALKSVVKVRPQVRCLLVGDGREREALEGRVKALELEKYVHLAGFREDIMPLISASDLFCMPSLSEGLPYALLEACTCRIPLLVTKVGGMAEILKHGETAVMVSPQNAEILSESLLDVIDHPRASRELADAAFELVQTQFSMETMVAKTLSVYCGQGKR